ncbi:MAG: hypothetical protein JXQ93_07055 [Flavobacteriaceae bacterium]
MEKVNKYSSDYYQTPRGDFYQEVESRKKWSDQQIKVFWDEFMQFYNNRTPSYLSSIVFPNTSSYDYIEAFFNSIKGRILFVKCVFSSQVSIGSKSMDMLEFNDCYFLSGLNFKRVKFGLLTLNSCVLNGDSIIRLSNFDNCNFISNHFIGDFELAKSHSKEDFLFEFNKILGEINIFNHRFSSTHHSIIRDLYTIDDGLLNKKQYYKLKYFQTLFIATSKYSVDSYMQDLLEIYNEDYNLLDEFDSKTSLIKGIKHFKDFQNYPTNPSIGLNNCILSSKVILSDIDMSRAMFSSTNVQDVNFLNCSWKKKNNRLYLLEEQFCKNAKKLQEIEIKYRQLKKNFHDKQDWETSGYCYSSELAMRKKRLRIEGSYLQFLVYSIYGFFGGYTQDFRRPLYWLLFSTFLLYPFFYYSSIVENLSLTDMNISGYASSLEISFSSTFPFLKTDLSFGSWWLKASQTLVSGVLLTFFILALRKRFKQ